ncbi:MAG: hypothetical protein HYX68_21145 [Planctomycetes bacterium]|nr:hypothetical protein [Planctomycetota bacterium]
MRKFWVSLFLVIVVVILASTGVVSVVLPIDRRSEAKQDIAAHVSAGKKLANQIRAFRSRTGLWPISLDELDLYEGKWSYTWDASGNWKLRQFVEFPSLAIVCDGNDEGTIWKLTDSEGEKILNSDVVSANSSNLTKLKLSTLEKRIKQHWRQVIHYQGLYSILMEAGAVQEAKIVGRRARDVFPGHWWGYAACAEAAENTRPKEFNELAQFVEKKDDFPHSTILAFLSMTLNDREFARRLLRNLPSKRVCDLPIPEMTESSPKLLMPDYVFFYESATIANRIEDNHALEEICALWESHWKKNGRTTDHSFLAFRAAILAKAGNFSGARCNLDLYERESRNGLVGDLTKLKNAIANKQSKVGFLPRPIDQIKVRIVYK